MGIKKWAIKGLDYYYRVFTLRTGLTDIERKRSHRTQSRNSNGLPNTDMDKI
jgi:hypothetical protein